MVVCVSWLRLCVRLFVFHFIPPPIPRGACLGRSNYIYVLYKVTAFLYVDQAMVQGETGERIDHTRIRENMKHRPQEPPITSSTLPPVEYTRTSTYTR